MKRYLAATGLASVLAAGGAFAGTLDPVMADAPVYTPAITPAPVAATGNWTGVYTGVQLGSGDIAVENQIDRDGDGDIDGDDDTFAFGGVLDGDGALGGVHAGYLWDLGTFVVGGELDYDKADIDLGLAGGGELDSVARAKLKMGYDAGQTLVYGILGGARADATVGGVDFSDTGYVVGAGVDYMVTPSFVVGGEVLYHDFGDDFDGTDVSVDATTFQVRASFKF